MNGYKEEQQQQGNGKSKSSALITRDLLGCCSTIDSKELDLDLQVPSGYEKLLDLKALLSYFELVLRGKMVLGKKCRSRSNEGLGLAFVRYTRSFVRRRGGMLDNTEIDFDCTVITPIKKHCNENLNLGSEKSMIEMLPQDILIRVLCGVEHDDLKRVVHVSKSFWNAVHLEDCGEFDEVEAPNAPKQWRIT